MTDQAKVGPDPDVIRIFDALCNNKNVLITGPPGTGKSRLLNKVARWFEQAPDASFDSEGDIPFPSDGNLRRLPSPDRNDRKSFKVIFHPGTRYRHLLRELEPIPNVSGSFRYSQGMLFQANEHALKDNGASLLVIDEINRGPAVEIFGDAVVPIEADKRLDESNTPCDQSFPILLANENGEKSEYYFSSHLYILAAMNSADASVAPMDVAFLRRWKPIELLPDVEVAKKALGLCEGSGTYGIAEELLRAFVDAWQSVNERISLLHGSDYQLGHAVVIPEEGRDLSDEGLVIRFLEERWSQLEQHVCELFYGEPRRQVAALAGSAEGSYVCQEGYVGSELTIRMDRPRPTTKEEWTSMLKSVSSNAQ